MPFLFITPVQLILISLSILCLFYFFPWSSKISCTCRFYLILIISFQEVLIIPCQKLILFFVLIVSPTEFRFLINFVSILRFFPRAVRSIAFAGSSLLSFQEVLTLCLNATVGRETKI